MAKNLIDGAPIGIVGLGMVGTQVERWFKLKKRRFVVYDKFKKIGRLENLNEAKIIFLCLPTPHKNTGEGADIAVIEETVNFFKEPKIFVVKSTVPPGTTAKLQKEFSRHYFLHNPEFLTEKTAWRDFSKPIFQIIGLTPKSGKIAKTIFNILPKGKISSVIPSESSEIFKYARNAFFAMKVIFANQIYDLSQVLNQDYEKIKNLMLAEPWIGGYHLNVFHKGYRGFGGKCLPKDLKTFIRVYKQRGLKPDLFQTVDRLNEKLIKRQNLTHALNNYWLQNKNHKKS